VLIAAIVLLVVLVLFAVCALVEVHEMREELATLVLQETKLLRRSVDELEEASVRTRILVECGVATAERALRQRPETIVVVAKSGDTPRRH
jgi:hypothetical protein